MNKLTNRSTKTELLAAYNAAIKELKALKAGKGAAPKQASAAPATAAAPTVANGEMSIADIIERLAERGVSAEFAAVQAAQKRKRGEAAFRIKRLAAR